MQERLATIEQRYDEIDGFLGDPAVSADYSRVQELVREQASIRKLAFLSREYSKVLREIEDTRELSREETDQEMARLAREELEELEGRRLEIEQDLRIALIPKDPNDEKNVIMEVRAGTGGEEAALFAGDLYRMYTRYAQDKKWRAEVIDASRTGNGGIKEIVMLVKGAGAYSRLKHESGTHRVQRVPTTESSGRIHTSAATVAVLPEAEEVDVDIRAEDLEIDIYHASGHGGQNVQKVATAVRITHKPTGIVATCQDESSQHKNREKAMSVLRARVLAQEVERQQREVSESRRAQVGSGDRSERVRTYNFPQRRVTDHRTGLTSHNLETVLDGSIDELIDAMVRQEQEQGLEAASV